MVENIIFEMADISNFRIGRQVKFLNWSTAEILKIVDYGTVYFIYSLTHGNYEEFNKFKIHNRNWEDPIFH